MQKFILKKKDERNVVNKCLNQ